MTRERNERAYRAGQKAGLFFGWFLVGVASALLLLAVLALYKVAL